MKNEIETLEKIQTIITFAKDIDAKFIIDGECGFGRPCVGISKDDHYIYYNPLDKKFEPIKDFYCEAFYDIKPEDAYHKTDCLAVLIHNENLAQAIDQMYHWVRKLKLLGVECLSYSKKEDLLSQMVGNPNRITFDVYALKIKKPTKSKKKTK